MADVEKITSLQELSSVAEDSLVSVFIENLEGIFTYSLQDVQSTLSPVSKPTLSRLHKTLCRQVVEVFAEYKERKPINRQAQHTLLADIGILGYSLANKSPHRDLEKIFHTSQVSHAEGEADLTSQQSELVELLVVTSLI